MVKAVSACVVGICIRQPLPGSKATDMIVLHWNLGRRDSLAGNEEKGVLEWNQLIQEQYEEVIFCRSRVALTVELAIIWFDHG